MLSSTEQIGLRPAPSPFGSSVSFTRVQKFIVSVMAIAGNPSPLPPARFMIFLMSFRPFTIEQSECMRRWTNLKSRGI